jgi:hypothetical protein
MATFHIAQVNIGRVKAPIDDPIMAGFVSQLDAINAIADRFPGFVWRLQTDSGNATYFRPYPEDDRILMNMSVWENIESLREYVYRGAHAEVMRHRRNWFELFAGVYVALWWVPAGHRPGVDEARKRLDHLQAHGPTQFAFTFARTFPPDEAFQSAIDWSSFVPCPAT